MRATIGSVLLSLLVPLLLLGAWFYLYTTKGTQNPYIADPQMVFAKIWALRGELAANAVLSLSRLGLGVIAGAALGAATGITLGRSRIARVCLAPTLNVAMAVPIIVYMPFFLMTFGIGELFRISVVAALVFLLVHQAMFSVVRAFPLELLELAAHRQKRGWEMAFQMFLPAGLPDLMHALRLSLLFGWLAIAFSEKAAAEWPNGGLGFQLLRARQQGLYHELFAAAITLGGVAWILDTLLGWVQRQVGHWRRTAEGEQ